MTNCKYTVSTRKTQFGLEPILKFENGVVTYPSTLISTDNNINMLLKNDANNYELCFFACGYDGNVQRRAFFIKYQSTYYI